MYKMQEYKGYTFEIGKLNVNSCGDEELSKLWYKTIIIPPKDKKRCLNIQFHSLLFTVNYFDINGISSLKNVKCVIRAFKDKGYISLIVNDKELNERKYILEDVSRQLIDYIENILDLSIDHENNNLIKRDKMGNLVRYEDINNNLTPTSEFHKLLLKHIVNSENPREEIEQITEMLNSIKSYIE